MIETLTTLLALLGRNDKLRCLATVVFMLVGAVLEIALVGAIPGSVALLADRSTLVSVPIIGNWEPVIQRMPDALLLLWMALGIVFLTLLKLVFFFALQRFVLETTYDIRVRLANWMFSSYLHAPWTFHLEFHSSELLRNCTTEVNETVNGVIQPLLNVLFGLIVAGFVLAMIVAVLPIQAFIAFAVTFAAAGMLLFILRKDLAMEGESAKLERMKMLRHFQEGLTNLVDARLLAREDWFLERFVLSISRFARSQNRIMMVSRMLPYAVEFVSIGGLLIVIVLLARQSGDLKSILPQITLIGVGLVRLRQSVSQVASNVAHIQYSLPSLQNVYDHTVALQAQLESPDSTAERCVFNDSIELTDLCFVYPRRTCPVLTDINLSIAKGSSVAFVGDTGCGKSTLLHVLLGLLAPSSGSVIVDGTDIRLQMREWRNLIGYVPQNISLLDATIEQNIALGDTKIDQGRLQQAIRIAQLEDMIADQPDGLHTIVGENGTRLSGGQRQRIGLARALYREPDVIVLDEATSALDYQTEAAITDSLSGIPWVATRIVVTHRLSTVQECDTIVMLQGGRILDKGSFSELSERHHSFGRSAAGKALRI